MNVLRETGYRVFGSPTFAGNPVTLFDVDALDDSTTLLQAAQGSSTTDNVFFATIDGGPVQARFFSPTGELWLCGHGLLALSQHLLAPGVARTREVLSPNDSFPGTSDRRWDIHVDAHGPSMFVPAQPATEVVEHAHWMHQALRTNGISYERLYACPNAVWIVVLREKDELLRLDAEAIAALPCGDTTPGALIAALSLPNASYGFRYFAPWHGKPEDSGTGSAHCYLAPLMAGATAPVTALQCSPAGVAEMRVWVRGNRVAVSGSVERLR